MQLAAQADGIAPEAIAGAILWEAIENPYHQSLFRPHGPGKVHASEWREKSEAQKVEEAGVVAPAKDMAEREGRLKQATWAVTYIAAIMGRHAQNYQTIAGVDISQNVGILCTLYQGGHSEARAQKLADRRKIDPTAQPTTADTMGPWVVNNLDWVKQTMGCTVAAPAQTPGVASG